jgi:RimJ/RimL family protein N-acetyltransferase
VAELRTTRLLMRRWHETDLAPFAALNDDPDVMRHFPARMDRESSDALARRADAGLGRHGWGLWAVEVRADDVKPNNAGEFIGFVGLNAPPFDAHFTPAIEVGWRLARRFWGRGYATEAAMAALAHGFRELHLDEIVSFTTVANERSRRVMERLGMRRDPADDFDHPSLAADDPIRPHVLYRLSREEFSGDLD